MLKRIFKKILSFILNPRLLLCLGIAWIITNGWSYIMLGIGTYFGIPWMIAVSGAYLTFLWLPISPEKIVTVFIAIGLMRLLFPHDEKTLGALKRLIKSIKEKHRKNKEKRAMKKRIENGTLTKSDELTLFLDKAKTPYSDIAIWHGHKEIYRHKSGYSNDDRNEETSGEELYFIYSLTKVMTAVAAMQLVERKIISLSDPVSKYLPEFAGISVKDGDTLRAPATVLTVRHLLSMTGGFDYDRKTPEILAVLKEKGSETTTRDVICAIAKTPLHFDPGSHFKYSMCHDILACVIEEAAKKSFGEYLKENILTPLGMNETYIGKVDEKVISRIATPYTYSDGDVFRVSERSSSFILSDYYESGGAGLISSLDDYILLIDALASGGEAKNGARILMPETIELLTKDELSQMARIDFKRDFSNKPGYSYGLGVRVHINPEESKGLSPIGEFGWSGAAGGYVLVDTQNNLAICYLEQVLGHPFAYDVVHPTVRDLAYGILEEYKMAQKETEK